MANLDLQTISSGDSLDDTTLNNNINLLNTVPLTGTALNNIPTFSEDEIITAADINEAFTAIKDNWIDTSDATAAASDIVNGKTAYVDGNVVTGSVTELTSGQSYSENALVPYVNTDGEIALDGTGVWKDFLFRKGAICRNSAKTSNFGDATAADVASGKTFTSAAGLKITGTASPEKVVANIIDFYSDMQNDHQHQIIITDKPIKNIESIWLNRFYISQDDPNFSSTIPPSDYYDNGWSYEFHQVFYDKNANIKGIMSGGLNGDSGYYTTDGATITSLTQPSPSIICLSLSDTVGLENYFPTDENNWGAGGRWYGYAIGETANNNTYYMKNIAGRQDNGFEWFSTNKYVQYNAGTRKWNLCRLYFNFITEGTVTLNFTINDIDYGEYLIVGNLNSPLNDDRYIDNSYSFCSSKITSNYTKSLTYSIPVGTSYIDIKVCSNTSSNIEAMTYFTVNI